MSRSIKRTRFPWHGKPWKQKHKSNKFEQAYVRSANKAMRQAANLLMKLEQDGAVYPSHQRQYYNLWWII